MSLYGFGPSRLDSFEGSFFRPRPLHCGKRFQVNLIWSKQATTLYRQSAFCHCWPHWTCFRVCHIKSFTILNTSDHNVPEYKQLDWVQDPVFSICPPENRHLAVEYSRGKTSFFQGVMPTPVCSNWALLSTDGWIPPGFYRIPLKLTSGALTLLFGDCLHGNLWFMSIL